MSLSQAPSLRELARSVGLSHTTVSEALRGNPRVKESTKKRILEAAAAAGYRHNPLAGALMSEMGRSRASTFRGVLAIVDIDGPGGRPASAAPYHEGLTRGASTRAAELGFKAEEIVIGRRGISVPRLDTILRSRGIRGLVVLPASDPPELARLDWTHYAGVYTDFLIEHPALNALCSDHYRSMTTALQRLHTLGYRRPGLVMEHRHDERLLHRWEAAYDAYQKHHEDIVCAPSLIVPQPTKEAFIAWFKSAKPDVVLCHRAEVIAWMESCGASVPKTHGFCCLNISLNSLPCAGLDLQPDVIGARAVELIIAQIYRNEYGIPAIPSTTTIPSRWVDGPTL
jgi:DNA-binding LacI/PurR family transcriptional regulator